MANNTTALYMKGFPHFVISDILMYLVSASVILINTIIVSTFIVQRWRRPSKTRLSPAGALVLNLIISDALVGALGIYITATFSETGGAIKAPYGCINRITPRFFFRMGSHLALINVALDRYIAITHTLHYRDWITMERCLALIALGWFVPLVGIAYAYLSNDWSPGLIFCYELKSFVSFLTYVRLPCHIAALFSVVIIQCRIFLYLRNHEKKESPQYLRKYSQKSARVLLWVTTTYVVCWLPFDTFLVLMVFLRIPYFKILLDVTVILAYISYLVNTFIFSYKTENIRKPVTELWSDLYKAVYGDKMASGGGVSQVSGGVAAGTGVKNISSRQSTSSIIVSSNTTSTSVVNRHENPVDTAELHI